MSAISEDKISELAALKEGWDSYGAGPIAPQALAVLRAVAVVPTVNCGVQIEWRASGWEVEIEVDASGGINSVMVERI